MNNPTPTPNQDTLQKLPSPWRCLTGALISGGFASALYLLTTSIAQSFASKPLPSTNQTAVNIAIAVRTLVVGMSTLATAIFGIVAVGLVALAIQVSLGQLRNRTASDSDSQ
ncbi:DUF3082 domain-containing protein [Lyngbya aestuarii]|uniref:DUF3082 domain-containing protein n=1 Tax=Lyngbya aestuarii TaxID=118322 RepID=UPI00403E10CB